MLVHSSNSDVTSTPMGPFRLYHPIITVNEPYTYLVKPQINKIAG